MSDTPRLTVVGPDGWPTPPRLPEDDAIDEIVDLLERLTEQHGEEVVYLAIDVYLARPGDHDDDER